VSQPIDLTSALATFDELWSPRIAARVNDYDVRITNTGDSDLIAPLTRQPREVCQSADDLSFRSEILPVDCFADVGVERRAVGYYEVTIHVGT